MTTVRDEVVTDPSIIAQLNALNNKNIATYNPSQDSEVTDPETISQLNKLAGINQPGQNNENNLINIFKSQLPILNKQIENAPHLMSGLNKINYLGNNILEPGLVGAGQGIVNTLMSLGNIPGDIASKISGKNFHVSSPELSDYIPTSDNPISNIAKKTGEIGGSLLGLGPLGDILGEVGGASNLISKIPVVGDTLSNIAKGAASGFALGGDNRSLGAGIGAIANPIMKGASAITNAFPKAIANNLVSAKNSLKDKYSQLYDDLFSKANELGVNKTPLELPNINLKLIDKHTAPGTTDALKDFIENPNFENAHWAQSDLGKLADKFSQAHVFQPLLSPQIKAWKEITNAQQKIKDSMANALDKTGNTDLANNYKQISQGYAKDVGPYIQGKTSDAINAYENNKILPSTLVEKVSKDEPFMISVGKNHPEIAHNINLGKVLSHISPILGNTIKYGGPAYAGTEIIKSLIDKFMPGHESDPYNRS